MKKLLTLLALTASVWSSFTFSQNYDIILQAVKQGSSNQTQYFTVSPNPLTVPTNNNIEAVIYYRETVTIKNFGGDSCYFLDSGQTTNTTFKCGTYATVFYLELSTPQPSTAEEPSQTCNTVEGAFIDGFHNSLDDFCANVGSTGGANPEPLLCVATNLSEIPAGSGNFQHTVTQQTCSAPTGPVAPDGEGPDPEPCTENCEPTDPETPPGGDDGTGIPDSSGGATGGNSNVGGTITDSDGKVTNIDLTIEQDFTPVTERLNETNKRLAVENKNSANLVEKVDALGQGLIEANDNLEGIKDAIAGIETGGDMSGVEGKLDGIKESIDGIKDGFGTAADGESAANGVDLPDYSQKFEEAWGQVEHSQANGEGGEGMHRLNNIGDNLTSFESIPQLFAFAQDNCSPIPFGRRSLDVCSYAPTISNVLTWVVYLLTLIFFVRSIQQHLQNVRL